MGASSHSWSASSTSTFITHCWSQPSLQKSNFTESTLHRASFNWQRQKVKPHYFDVGVKRNMYERLDHYGNDNSILDGNNQLARKCGSDCSSLMLIWEIIPVTLKNNTQRTKNTPSRLGEYLNNSKAFNRAKQRCLAGWALFRGNLYSSGKYFRFFRSWCFAASESWHLFFNSYQISLLEHWKQCALRWRSGQEEVSKIQRKDTNKISNQNNFFMNICIPNHLISG